MKLERIGPGSFASCISKLGDNRFANAKEVMQNRLDMRKTSDAKHFSAGTWLAENTNVINGQIMLARRPYNPLIHYAKKEGEVLNNREFYPLDKILINGKPAVSVLTEIEKADSTKPLIKKRVFIPIMNSTYQVSWDRLNEDDIMVWHAQSEKTAKEYGKAIFNDHGIEEITIFLPSTNLVDIFRLGNIAKGNYLFSPYNSGKSNLNCNHRMNVEYSILFGIRDKDLD